MREKPLIPPGPLPPVSVICARANELLHLFASQTLPHCHIYSSLCSLTLEETRRNQQEASTNLLPTLSLPPPKKKKQKCLFCPMHNTWPRQVNALRLLLGLPWIWNLRKGSIMHRKKAWGCAILLPWGWCWWGYKAQPWSYAPLPDLGPRPCPCGRQLQQCSVCVQDSHSTSQPNHQGQSM